MATATIETSNSKDDPSDVIVEEIFVPDSLPPGNTPAADAASANGRPALKPRDIETLDFEIPGERQFFRVVPLRHPFRRNGEIVRDITVRRLTVGEVGDLIDDRPGDMPDFFDIYAVMTGLPAAVLRGLIDIDGEMVAGACYDFLPRYFRPPSTAPTASSSTSVDGAA